MSGYIDVFKRTEIKYLLSPEQFERLQEFLQDYARVDDYGKTRINNIYFDTPDYKLIRASLEKPVYKEKLRLRTYGDTYDFTNSFIEIKKKYKGIVYKRRVAGAYKKAYDYLIKDGSPLDDSQISKEIEGFRMMYQGLRPAMAIYYDRIAMIGTEDPNLRITFDTNIRWNKDSLDLRKLTKGNVIVKDGEYLMEIKVAESMPLYLARELSRLGIFPASFSKYGRGYTEMISGQTHKFIEEPETIGGFEREVIAYA
ncbi:MAG: polyphosphate polymerase domain-containing protein [Eubacterium sp.]|nr:polyphosphate polymerase domain-containing protein [Eubacterium sp.]